MNYRIWLLSLCLGAASAVAEVQKIPGVPIPIELIGGEFSLHEVPLSVLVKTLERGYPYVGTVKEPPKTDPGKSQQQLIDDMRAAAKDNQTKTLAQAEALNTWKRDILAGRLPAPQQGKQPVAVERLPVLAWSPQNQEEFLKCAARSLPLLKARLLSQKRGDTRAMLQLEALTLPERGDGISVSAEGIACGKYLGQVGFETRDSLEEVKWLSALLAVKQPQKAAAWRLFSLYGNAMKGKTLAAAHFWTYAWKRAAFKFAFQEGASASREDLERDYLEAYSSAEKSMAPSFVITDKNQMAEAIQSDWKTGNE